MKKSRSTKATAAPPRETPRRVAKDSGAPALAIWLGFTLLAIILVWIAYSPAVSGGYVFDDIALTFRTDPAYAARSALSVVRGVRPLTELSYWVSYQISGDRPFLHHLISVLLHAGSSVLLGYLLLRLMTIVGFTASRARWLAAIGAGIFLLHPANTEAVAYISSRSEALSVFFYFAALTVFVGRAEPAISWARALCVLALFVMAMLSKEHSLTLPVALALIDLLVYRFSIREALSFGWRLYGVMVAGALMGAAVVANTLSGAVTAGFGMKDLQWWEYLLTQGRAIALYFRLYLLPVNQSGDYLFPISRSPWDYGAIFYWAVIAALAVTAFVYRKRTPLISFGLLLFLVLLMPTSSILPIQDAAVERRVYLSSLGLVIATVGLLSRLPISANLLRYASLAVLFVLAIGTYQRSIVWASHDALWNDVLAKNPESWRANVQVGLTALEHQRCSEALARFEKAMPDVAQNFAASLHMNYARALDCVDRIQDAEKEFHVSLAIEDQAATWTQLGVFYARRQRPADALESFNRAIEKAPRFPLAWSNRGNLHARQGDCLAATKDFEEALRLMPSNVTAQRGLAYCRERLGQ